MEILHGNGRYVEDGNSPGRKAEPRSPDNRATMYPSEPSNQHSCCAQRLGLSLAGLRLLWPNPHPSRNSSRHLCSHTGRDPTQKHFGQSKAVCLLSLR